VFSATMRARAAQPRRPPSRVQVASSFAIRSDATQSSQSRAATTALTEEAWVNRARAVVKFRLRESAALTVTVVLFPRHFSVWSDADHCPCLPDSENPECPADQVCCDEGTPLGDPDDFVCKGGGTCGAIPCSAQKCGLKGSETNLEFAFAYCSPGCGKDKAGCIDSCDTCSTGGAVTNNCNNVNSGIEGTGEEQGNSYCSGLKKKLGYDVSNCCICKSSDPVGQAGCIAPTS
jgi:hypothetical protein